MSNVDVLTLDHAGDDVSEIVVHVVFVVTVVSLLVHLDVLHDNVESISFDRTCCRRCRFHILMSNFVVDNVVQLVVVLLNVVVEFVVLSCCDPFCCCTLEMPIPDVAPPAKELVVRCQWCKRILLSMRSMSSMNAAVGADPESVVVELLLQNYC